MDTEIAGDLHDRSPGRSARHRHEPLIKPPSCLWHNHSSIAHASTVLGELQPSFGPLSSDRLYLLTADGAVRWAGRARPAPSGPRIPERPPARSPEKPDPAAQRAPRAAASSAVTARYSVSRCTGGFS